MLHIAVCDDIPEELEKITQLTRGYLRAHSPDAQVMGFLHPDALLTACEKTSFDLFLLDVVMPMFTGIDVGRELRRRKSQAQIIYLTTSDDFAVEAFGVQASHYLLKPINHDDFYAAMDRALRLLESAVSKYLTIRTEGGAVYNLELNEILYIESCDHQQNIHCKAEAFTEGRRSLARLQEEIEALAPGQFAAPYKGYLVNFCAVRMVNSDHILLKNGVTIPLAQRSFRQVRDSYFDFFFGREGNA